MYESSSSGLTSTQAAERLALEGPNLLPRDGHKTVLGIVLGVFREPMLVLLLSAAGLYFVLGDVREAVTLLGSVVLILSLTVVQEGRTERALEALRDLSMPRVRVMRDGALKIIAVGDLVRGDLVSVSEGDRVPADAVLRGGVLHVDESQLSGESVPVVKGPSSTAGSTEAAPGSEKAFSSLFSGSLIVSGKGFAEIVATGPRSYLGRLGKSLAELVPGATPLQSEIRSIVQRIAVIAVLLSIVLAVTKGLAGGGWVEGTLAGITLAMALLPEEFPLVFTVFSALGARRIAAHGVLTRQMAAVETLGAVHVLCTDKTGTLTRNRMTIGRLRTADADVVLPVEGAVELPEAIHSLVEFGILACPKDPFDPMEKALLELGHHTLERTEHLHPKWRAIREYPLSPELLAVTHVWSGDERGTLVVATKGAPEAIFDLCHLAPAELEPWRVRCREMAEDGLRVLGVARATGRVDVSPERAHDVPFEMLGLVGLQDPLRDEVPGAIAECLRAGIRIMMITGDAPDTARSIAKAAGIPATHVLTGTDVEMLPDEELTARLLETNVVARAVPAHKLRIVALLRAKGLVVAMTGDGVNDAPALKAADVGVAMGARGTDVAREAAKLVLEDDSFGGIVDAIRVGRRIFDNLQKAFTYLVAVHVPIAGLSLLPALFGWPSVLAPAHIVFLELIIDPASSIVFEMEPEEPDVMDRPPRPSKQALMTKARLGWSFLSGLLVLAAALGVLAAARAAGKPFGEQRALAFVALVAGNLAILVATRSTVTSFWSRGGSRNIAALVLGAATSLVTLGTIALSPLRRLFGFDACGGYDLSRAALVAAIPVLVLGALRGAASDRKARRSTPRARKSVVGTHTLRR